MKKLVADRAKCMGNGNCVMSAPQVFAQGAHDGLVQLIDTHPGPAQWASVELAVRSCPSGALRIVEDNE